MSGLLALLDDVAGIAKMAAASLDDVASQAAKAGGKAAGALIDDAAVTPKYVHGLSAERELPIIWKIVKGSLKNKLLYLLPLALLLSSFAPWAISPLLMLGGAFLCYEGAEKVVHAFMPHAPPADGKAPVVDPAGLEEAKAAGAIRTDFILSAEIMTIALAAIPVGSVWFMAATLALVAVGITAAVYGSVALIVKADDLGLLMARAGRLSAIRALGRGIVAAMPGFMTWLTRVGTAAMLWVGGSIIIHGLKAIGLDWPWAQIHRLAVATAEMLPEALRAAATWTVTATIDGIAGLALGLVLVPVVTWAIAPLWRVVRGGGY